MNRFILGVLALLIAAPALAQTNFGPLQADRNGQEVAQDLTSPTGRFLHMAGTFCQTTATASTTAATTEQTLASCSLPANTLDLVGRMLWVHASFSAASNSNNKTFKCYFGAEVISSGVLSTSGKNGDCDLYIVKSGASAQIVSGKMIVDTTPITGYVATGAENDQAAITVKFTGTDGSASAGDIVMNQFFAVLLN